MDRKSPYLDGWLRLAAFLARSFFKLPIKKVCQEMLDRGNNSDLPFIRCICKVIDMREGDE